MGVTNFDVPRLKEIVDSGVNIASNQVPSWLAARNITVYPHRAWRPLHAGGTQRCGIIACKPCNGQPALGCLVCFTNQRSRCDSLCPHAQVQYSLLDRRPENGMTAYCADAGISLLPYGTVAGGLLSDRYLGLPASK